MNYFGMPLGMWLLFKGSFQKNMTVLGFDQRTAAEVVALAGPKYKEIIAKLPEFEKGDRFKMNIVNCALFGALLLSMKEKPSLDKLTEYYSRSRMTAPMKWFCRMSGKSKFTPKDIRAMKELGLSDFVPAMCKLDYTMSEAGGASDFLRKFTLASGGPYCDCGYRKRAVSRDCNDGS